MSCHYSCATCYNSTYADLCLSCPATRYLVDTSCLCQSNYYQYQTSNCLSSSQITPFDANIYRMFTVVYFIMIGVSWIQVIFNLNHFYSRKIRTFITFSQIMALILDYRYRLSSIASHSLQLFSVWNFKYFNNFVCSQKSKPYECQSYENILGPIFIFLVFVGLLIISFFITKMWIVSTLNEQNQQQKQADQIAVVNRKKQIYKQYDLNEHSAVLKFSFIDYIKVNFRSFLLIYLDYTIINTGAQLSRIAFINGYTLLIYVPILIFLLLYSFYVLGIINSKNQFKIEYRSINGYFFLYDQNYHLNYLDYLYEEEAQSKRDKNYIPQHYYPHSNYIIYEIAIKFLFSSSTILLFQFKPQIFGFCLNLCLIIILLKLGVFQVYERGNLLIYIGCSIIYLITIFIFQQDIVFITYMVAISMITSTLIVILMVSTGFEWTKQRQGKYYALAFQYMNANTQNADESQQNTIFTQSEPQKNQSNEVKSSQQLLQNKNLSVQIQDLISNKIENTYELTQQTPKSILRKSKLSFQKSNGMDKKSSLQSAIRRTENVSQAEQNSINQQKNESFMSKTNRSKFGVTHNISNNQKKSHYSKFNETISKQKSQGKSLPKIEQDKSQEDSVEITNNANIDEKFNKSSQLLVQPRTLNIFEVQKQKSNASQSKHGSRKTKRSHQSKVN